MKPLPLAIALIVAAGCSGGGGDSYVPVKKQAIPEAKVAPGQEAALFPFAVGNSWTYVARTAARVKNRQSTQEAEITFRVAKIEDTKNGKRATIDLITKDKVVDRQVWLSNSRGIYQISIGATKPRVFTSPIPAILFPVEPAKRFSWKGGDGNVNMTLNFTVTGAQEVDTEEKRLSAIAVESTGTSVKGKLTEKTERVIWFAPGIGIARIRESTASSVGASELLLSLKSHNVK